MKEFTNWIDKQIPEKLPSEVKGISFNLFEHVEGFGIEILGAKV
jgi:hypothetical protein